jgi:hypothetical protein
MRIDSTGNVGIGATVPLMKLDVRGNSGIMGSLILGGLNVGQGINAWDTDYTGAANLFNILRIGGNDIQFGFFNQLHFKNTLSSTEPMTIFANGNVGIGSTSPGYKLDVTGDIHASNTLIANATVYSSDIRLKEKLTPVENSLDRISKITAYNYFWKDKTVRGDRRQLGVIAQDVEKVFPEAVITDHDGFLAVNYPSLVAPLIEAVKTLYTRVTNLTGKVVQIYARLTHHDAQLADLELRAASLAKENADLKAHQALIEERLNRLERQPASK